MSRTVLAIITVLLAAAAAAAQLSVNVDLINVVVTVTDRSGAYVSDLIARDFILEEDGKRQEIAHFSHSRDLPVTVGILLDSSTSMERKIGTATRAVDRFIRDIHPEDEIFLMTFDSSVRLRQNFTNDREKLSKALDKVKLSWGTSLYDGVLDGIDKIRKGKYPKKALLLISDGVDSTSQHDYTVARIGVRESEVIIYALGIAPDRGLSSPMPESRPIPRTIPNPTPLPGGGGLPFPIPLPGPGRRTVSAQGDYDLVDMDILNTFADESGGKAWLIGVDNRRARLQDAFDEIASELRNQYSLGYYPGHPLKDGKWHRVELRLRNLDYGVRYKQDYFGQ